MSTQDDYDCYKNELRETILKPNWKCKISTHNRTEVIVVDMIYKTDMNFVDQFVRIEDYKGGTAYIPKDDVVAITIKVIEDE